MMNPNDPLHQDLDTYIRVRIRSLKMRVVLFGVLLLFLCIYFSILLSAFRGLDAQTLVNSTAKEVEGYLPEAQARLEAFVIDSMPGMLDIAERRILEEPGKRRIQAEVVIHSYAKERVSTYQTDLNDLLDKAIKDGLADLEKVVPDTTRPDQLALVIDGIIGSVEKSWAGFFTDTGSAYQQDMRTFSDYMRTLADGGKLERKKQIERNLIQASIALNDRAAKQSGM